MIDLFLNVHGMKTPEKKPKKKFDIYWNGENQKSKKIPLQSCFKNARFKRSCRSRDKFKMPPQYG